MQLSWFPWSPIDLRAKPALPVPPGLLAGGAPSAIPPIMRVEHQCRQNWCWAAVTVSVLRLAPAKPQHTQCGLAFNVITSYSPGAVGYEQCCDGRCDDQLGGAGTGDTPWPLDYALRYAGIMDQQQPISGCLNPVTISAELAGGRPIGIYVQWSATPPSGHCAAVVGMHSDLGGGVWLAISDPIYGDFGLRWTQDGRGYRNNQGQWICSYPTRP